MQELHKVAGAWCNGGTNQVTDALSQSLVSFLTSQEILVESNEKFTIAEIKSLHQDRLESRSCTNMRLFTKLTNI